MDTNNIFQEKSKAKQLNKLNAAFFALHITLKSNVKSTNKNVKHQAQTFKSSIGHYFNNKPQNERGKLSSELSLLSTGVNYN